jgi:hypothetical protein
VDDHYNPASRYSTPDAVPGYQQQKATLENAPPSNYSTHIA